MDNLLWRNGFPYRAIHNVLSSINGRSLKLIYRYKMITVEESKNDRYFTRSSFPIAPRITVKSDLKKKEKTKAKHWQSLKCLSPKLPSPP